MTFDLHPYCEPIEVGGLTFDLPTFTDPEHARYVGVLVTRLFAAALSERATVERSIVEGLEAVTDCLWRMAMQVDGVCPLLGGLLVRRGAAWSTEAAIAATDHFRAALARGDHEPLRRALLVALGNLFMQERAVVALLERADPARRYAFTHTTDNLARETWPLQR